VRILVTEGMYKHSLAVVRALGSLNHHVELIDSRWSSGVARYSKYCRKVHVIERINKEDEFISFLIDILKREKFDLVIPVGFPVVKWIAFAQEEIKKYTGVFLPDFATLELLEDKKSCLQLANKLGIPVPLTQYPTSFESAVEGIENYRYPLVIKAIHEQGSNLVDYVFSADEFCSKYKSLMDKQNAEDEEHLPMIQQYLPGKSRGYFGLYKDGHCLQYFMHERLMTYPVSGGSSVLALSIEDNVIRQYGHKILAETQYTGLAMVEFKDDADGVPHVVEVNPKLWGSFDLSMASGVNFLDKLIQTVNGKKITNETYEKGLIFSWFFDDGWRSAKQNKTMLKEFLSILTGKYKTNATRRDIVPSFRLFWTFFRKLFF